MVCHDGVWSLQFLLWASKPAWRRFLKLNQVMVSSLSLKRDSARQRQAIKNFQAAGGGSAADGRAAYEATKNNPSAMAALDKQLGL